jgi:hypothetical protein
MAADTNAVLNLCQETYRGDIAGKKALSPHKKAPAIPRQINGRNPEKPLYLHLLTTIGSIPKITRKITRI